MPAPSDEKHLEPAVAPPMQRAQSTMAHVVQHGGTAAEEEEEEEEEVEAESGRPIGMLAAAAVSTGGKRCETHSDGGVRPMSIEEIQNTNKPNIVPLRLREPSACFDACCSSSSSSSSSVPSLSRATSGTGAGSGSRPADECACIRQSDA